MLVVISHGVRNGTGTALVYGKDRLTAKDFPPGLLHRLDLAVLIACSSGVGGDNGPLESDNLVRPFLSAGVPFVIASRWDVDSRASARLMEQFHQHLGSGEGVVSALSLARKQLRREKPHPYYWAAFDLDGRGR
jgi:CHAT domain-containing protein